MKFASSGYSAIYLALFFVITGLFGFLYDYHNEIENLNPYTTQNIIGLLAILLYLKSQLKIDLKFSINIINIYVFVFLLFFVIGAMLLSFGSNALIYLKLNEFYVSPNECFEVNNYNFLGFGISLLIAKLIKYKFIKIDGLGKYIPSRVNLLFLFLLVILLIFSRLYVFLLNIYPNFYPNFGFLTILALASNGIIGILLCYKNLKLDILAIIVTIIFTFLGIIELNKLVSVLPTVVLGCSFSIRHNSKLILLSTFVAAFFIIKALYPIVNYSRINIGEDRNISERITVLYEGFKKKYSAFSIIFFNNEISTKEISTNNVTKDEGVSTNFDVKELANLSNDLGYSIWFRICYITEQVAAIRFYKNGIDSGEQLRNVAWLFLPRIFFSNKPKFSDHIGPGLYHKMTGYHNSSSSPGIFIEGYYRNGNIGFMVNTLIFGIAIGLCQIFLAVALLRKNYLMIPFVFISFLIPFRVDGHFFIDILATFITLFLFIFIFLSLLNFNYIYEIIKKRVLR